MLPSPSGEGLDRIRNERFADLLERNVFTVDPPLECLTSEIRAAYRRGDAAWQRGVAPRARWASSSSPSKARAGC